jgi:secreted trypsin-like serine protease
LKINLILSLTLLLSFAACVNKNDSFNADLTQSSGILGGTPATASDRVTASTVALIYMAGDAPESFCTGTLISKNLILTATHCLKDMEIEDIQIYFGETLPKNFESENFRKIKTAVTHPDYKFELDPVENVFTGFNDVGLVLIDGEAPAFAKPVAVLNDSELAIGQSLLLAGYGFINELTVPVTRATGLNQVRVSIIKKYNNILVTEQSNAQGACAGDSGGPAYLETIQGLIALGITRGPYNLAKDCRHWGEYTYASRFKDYILKTASDMGADAPAFVDAPAGSLIPEIFRAPVPKVEGPFPLPPIVLDFADDGL